MFSKNKYHGKGKYSDENYSYEGEFSEGKINKGWKVWAGMVYEGEFLMKRLKGMGLWNILTAQNIRGNLKII